MARQKTYQRDDLLDRVMHRFWADGYHRTSARELAASTGVNVSTLYSEFLNKEGLYAAALDRYERTVVDRFFGPLEAPDASIATVRATLAQFPAMARTVDVAPGCFVTNAAIEHAPSAADSASAMARYIARVSAGIQHALTNTGHAHAIDDAETRALANHVTATLLGLFVMTRAQTNFGILDDVVQSAIAQIDAFAARYGIPEPTAARS